MVASVLKRVAARFPESMQLELRRMFFRNQIRNRRFFTDEKEFGLLDRYLRPGDWALDVGANVGHYTMRMSELVGPEGRVIALEPVPTTFALLAANAAHFPHANVSLLNVAASDETAMVGVQIPRFSGGLTNYYQAHLSSGPAPLHVLTLPIDALAISTAIRLVKIDVEGHEMPVLQGMRKVIERDHPVLIVETSSSDVTTWIGARGYVCQRMPGSSNLLCTPTG